MGRILLSLWTWFEIALCAVAGFLTQLVPAPFTLPFDRAVSSSVAASALGPRSRYQLACDCLQIRFSLLGDDLLRADQGLPLLKMRSFLEFASSEASRPARLGPRGRHCRGGIVGPGMPRVAPFHLGLGRRPRSPPETWKIARDL